MSIKLYRRRPVTVEVREVTKDNVEELAEWAGGQIHGGTLFIAVSVGRAYVNPTFTGDLIVHEGHHFTIWRDRDFFDSTFEPLA